MYQYKYIPSSIIIQPTAGSSPKDVYTNLFAQTLKEQFYNSSNWWTIQEETNAGTQIYQTVNVRIAHLINAETGLKLGDDWKTLLFSDINHSIELGKHYIFDENTWLTTNTEIRKNLSATCTIRRCNNTLRWIDESTGAYYEEPCIIEYEVKEPRDYFTQGSPFMTPGGFLHILTQFNNRTNLINENQRFLFGNSGHWTCYKVIGTGINDFKNEKTYDNTSAKILTLDVIANFVNNELDDVVNGIADANTNLYTVSLNKTSAQGTPSSTVQLIPSITYNGKSVTRTINWTTSSSSIATVNISGLVTLIATGSCLITANIAHSSASAVCSILVTGSPIANNEVTISPDINYILEGMSRTYSVYLYTNDVQQADAFVVSCIPNGISQTNYTFNQIDGNNFYIKNNVRDISSYLTIQVTSGSHVASRNIYLKGAW